MPVIAIITVFLLQATRSTDKIGSPASPYPQSTKEFQYEMTQKWNRSVNDLDSLFAGKIDTINALVVKVRDYVRIGDSISDFMLNVDGEIYARFIQIDSAWDDLRFPFTGANIDVVSGRIDYDYVECTVDFQINARFPEEPVCFVAQMPHAKIMSTSIEPHLHWIQEQDTTPNWLIMTRFYNNGEVPPATWDTATYTKHIFTYTADALQITEFPMVSAPAGESVSAICDIRFFRDTQNASGKFAGTDGYSVEAKTKEFDFHIMLETFGSRTEYTK